MDTPDFERLARLESEVAALREELTALRRSLAPIGRPNPAQPQQLPSTKDRPAMPGSVGPVPRPPNTIVPRVPSLSLEEIIGQYGTLAVATITVLVGVGIFLSYAIEKGYLGPTVRVVLGLIAAIGVALGGVRFRLQGTREFGNVLMALALAMVEVVCWSAGPLLHVVPSFVALLGAAAAS